MPLTQTRTIDHVNRAVLIRQEDAEFENVDFEKMIATFFKAQSATVNEYGDVRIENSPINMTYPAGHQIESFIRWYDYDR